MKRRCAFNAVGAVNAAERCVLLVTALLVAGLALGVRWQWAATPRGPLLLPRPDAVEYAASAQALAQSGKFFLQVGPYRARPRYSPGWPLILAVAARLGVRGEELWRVAGLFGAALAAMLSLVAARLVLLLSGGPSGGWRFAGAAAAGLLAGGGWALAPIAAVTGATALSDEPATAVGAACLLATAWALLFRKERATLARSAKIGAGAGGLAWGLLASMRPVAALLLLPALLLLFLGGARQVGSGPAGRGASGRFAGLRSSLRLGVAWSCGAAVLPLLTALVLWRSGLEPWRWTGYEFWVPYHYGAAGDAFELRNMTRGPDVGIGLQGDSIPNLELAALVLCGLPGAADAYLGLYWPLLGWLCLAPLALLARHADRRAALALGWSAGAVLAAVAAHVVLYSLYFFPSTRFYLLPLALPLTSLAAVCGLALASGGSKGAAASAGAMASGESRGATASGDAGACAGSASAGGAGDARRAVWRVLGALGTAALATALVAGFAAFRTTLASDAAPRDRTRAEVAAWLALSDAQRARRVVPFDPVYAQALGLLDPHAVEGIHSWGTLPPTVHVRRLRGLGLMPDPSPN